MGVERAGSQRLFDRARRVIPGGVNSPVRAFRGVGGTPVFFKRGARRLAHRRGRQPLRRPRRQLGSAHPRARPSGASSRRSPPPRTRDHLRRAARRRGRAGRADLPAHAGGGEGAAGLLAAPRRRSPPCGSPAASPAATCCSSSRAATTAPATRSWSRRGAGWRRWVCRTRRACRRRWPRSRSPRRSTTSPRARAALRASRGKEIAAVIVEPVVGNMGVLVPRAGFLEGLAELCREARRAAHLRRGDDRLPARAGRRAGAVRARRRTSPPWGRSSAAGCRWARTAARRDHGDGSRPAGPVYQAGTLSGNPLAVAAGWPACARWEPGVYEKLEGISPGVDRRARWRRRGQARVPVTLNRVGSMWTPVLHRGAGLRLPERQEGGHQEVRDVLPRPARPGRVPAAHPVRGGVRLAGHGRARGRAHSRRGPPGVPGAVAPQGARHLVTGHLVTAPPGAGRAPISLNHRALLRDRAPGATRAPVLWKTGAKTRTGASSAPRPAQSGLRRPTSARSGVSSAGCWWAAAPDGSSTASCTARPGG